ncbi:unnamed protein product [Closterium sp. NIES-65]|nr:unnamed protein product [Closterium sp. NIES-65]
MRISDSRRTAPSPSLCARLVCAPLPSRRCLLLGALVLQLLGLALLLPRLPPIPRHALSANPLPRNFLPRSVLKRNSLPRDFRGKRAEREEAEGLEEDGAWRLYQQWRGDLMGAGTGGVTGRAGDREQEADGERKKDAEQQQQQGGEWERCGGVGDAASMRSAAGMMADDGPRHAMPPQMKPGNTAGGAAGSGGVRYLMVEVNGGLNQQRTAHGGAEHLWRKCLRAVTPARIAMASYAHQQREQRVGRSQQCGKANNSTTLCTARCILSAAPSLVLPPPPRTPRHTAASGPSLPMCWGQQLHWGGTMVLLCAAAAGRVVLHMTDALGALVNQGRGDEGDRGVLCRMLATAPPSCTGSLGVGPAVAGLLGLLPSLPDALVHGSV